ncbi:VOC family protein [Paenibacillus sp. BC26]|uniref:VOC family protein n=1 Tax=Paenibacillus sp. BC26 TaxID=1881032 RepID=UPI0008EBFB70|nr:VOC family protein [Paenibacillus sp. BC26]SFT27323.1 Glyoxalase/Bleomycin resistance protein/Dioxygenase superfamily protein [Paenibacillus sp. BC26]
MRVKLEGITILADDVASLASFYKNVIGFQAAVEEEHYVALVNDGVRLAFCSRSLMAENTNNHPSFLNHRQGQAFELNFECDSPEDVHELFEQYVAKGAVAITEPTPQPWGHTACFFADPEGNIHSLFAVNPA